MSTSEPQDPFRSSMSVDERIKAMRSFTVDDMMNALQYSPMLQQSVRNILITRLTRERQKVTDPERIKAIDQAMWGTRV